MSPADAVRHIDRLRELCRERGRDVRELELIVSPYTIRITRDDLARYRDAGVQELVMLGNPPETDAQIDSWIERLAAEWVAPAARLG